jgi:hypothetical protein
LKLNLLATPLVLIIATTLFSADKINPINQPTNQNFIDVLQTINGDTSTVGITTNNIPVVPNKTTQTQQNQIQDKGCTRIIVDNKTVIYHCGEKTFLKRFGADGGLFLILSDGKKIKLTD